MGRVLKRSAVVLLGLLSGSLLFSAPAWAPPPPTRPGPPTSVTVTPGNRQTTVSWFESWNIASGGYLADSYVAHVQLAKGGNHCSHVAVNGFPFAQDKCTIVGLTNGTHYVVVVYPLYRSVGPRERHGIPSMAVRFIAGP